MTQRQKKLFISAITCLTFRQNSDQFKVICIQLSTGKSCIGLDLCLVLWFLHLPISYLVPFEYLLHLLCVIETVSINTQRKSNTTKLSTNSNGIIPSRHGPLLEGLVTDKIPQVNSYTARSRTTLEFHGKDPDCFNFITHWSNWCFVFTHGSQISESYLALMDSA